MVKKIECVAAKGCDFKICGERITDNKPTTLVLNRIVRRHLKDGSIFKYKKSKSKTNPKKDFDIDEVLNDNKNSK